MESQQDYLVLSGPGHLQIVRLKPGQNYYQMQGASDGSALIQHYTYRVVMVGAGTHSQIGFLIPAHLSDQPAHEAGWVFNQLVQALMTPHPMNNHVLLGLNFSVTRREDPTTKLRAEVRAHVIGANGMVRLAPVDAWDCNRIIHPEELRYLKQSEDHLKSVVGTTAHQALRPFVDRAVHSLLQNQGWT